MVPTGYGSERDNLDEPDEQDILRDEAEQEIARRLREGESYRSISKEMGISTRQVFKVNQVLKKSAPESPCFTVSPSETPRNVSGVAAS